MKVAVDDAIRDVEEGKFCCEEEASCGGQWLSFGRSNIGKKRSGGTSTWTSTDDEDVYFGLLCWHDGG